jgi:uncharacterized protein YprB with RNaseH-like and TPR domain
VPESPLDRLERSLLGEVEAGLTLKERLERLVAVASRGRSLAERAGPALEELVDGRVVENEFGTFFLVESATHLETRHGLLPLSRVQALAPEAVAVLAGGPEWDGFDLTQAVFLDTETTGLAGGTGTAAFLIGIGYVEGSHFRVRQYFMRDYVEEAAQLAELTRDLAGFRQLVTFNGALFDVPLLEARFRLNRARFPLSDAAHLDLLHPARRLWKLRLESCRLQSLEAQLLGVRRQEDVPGEEIPRLYFDYVRSRNARFLPRILEHNRLDLVSLAALAVLACQWVVDDHAEDPRDVLSLARVLERARLDERAAAHYARAAASRHDGVRLPALLRLAQQAKRDGDLARAVALWEEAAAEGDLRALRELAMHHEHRRRDYAAALALAERGLALADPDGDPGSRRAAADFARRRARLLRKMRRADVAVPGPASERG